MLLSLLSTVGTGPPPAGGGESGGLLLALAVFGGPAGATVTGTLAATEENDITGSPLTADTTAYTADSTILTADLTRVGSWTGVVTVTAVTGTLGATEAGDTAAFSGNDTTGLLAATEASDTAALTGAVTPPTTGTLAATEAGDTGAFSGTVAATETGTLAATEASDAAAFSGAVLVPIVITGTLGATESPDVAVFLGQVGEIVPPVPAVRQPAVSGGGGGRGSSTRGRVSQRLSRKELELLIAGLPEADQKEMLQTMDDEDVAFLLENS